MPKAKGATTRAKGTPRVWAVCARCEVRHHRFARCKDGVKLIPGNQFAAGEAHPKSKVVAAGADAVLAVAVAEPTVALTPSQQARADMRAMIEGLPEDSAQRKSLTLMLERDEARETHMTDEQRYAETHPGQKLPLPLILRDLSDDKGRKLNSELDALLYRSGQAPKMDNLREEAQTIKDTLAGIPAKRDLEERAAREAMKLPERIPGEQKWECQNGECGVKFDSLTIDQARRRAKDNPGWMIACPACGGRKVLALQAVAA